MTGMDAALRRDSRTLAELAHRYDCPVDLAAVGVLHLLMENADLVHIGDSPLLIIPTTIDLIDAINQVLAPLEDDEDDGTAEAEPDDELDDPPEDDDPGGTVLDRGEADNCDDEPDHDAERESWPEFDPDRQRGAVLA